MIKDFIKYFLFTLSLVSVTLALEGECNEIKDIVSKENPDDGSFFEHNIETCNMENGKVIELDITGRDISEDTFKKILDNKMFITKLSIRYTDLTQSHIDAIGALTSLNELEFVYCNFEKNLNLKSLNRIFTLSLYYSETTSIKDFRVFTNLKKLYINNSYPNVAIDSDVINTIFNSYFIEELDLININDVDWSKISINSLETLRRFYCSQCHMNTIPDSIFQLEDLQSLSITNDEISEIPDDIKKLQNLTKLELLDNKITEIPKAITELTNLQVLLLGSNLIKSIPDEFENLDQLYDLSLGDNQLEKFPSVFKNLKKLKYLDLDNNKIYDVLPEYFNDFPELTMIYLNNNGNIKGKVITNDNLEVCYYNKAYDLCIPEGKEIRCFPDDYNFKTCDDNSNPTENDECDDLHSYLEGKESGLYKKIVTQCIASSQGKLETLHLQEFTVDKDFVEKLSSYTDIEELYLETCDLPDSLDYDALKKLSKLVTLKIISRNTESNSIPSFVDGLESLKELTFAKNEITSIPTFIFNNTNLEYLNLFENEIEEIPVEIKNLKNLKELNLQSNKIEEIPKEIGELNNLEILDLGSNLISEIPDEVGNLENLKQFILNYNHLTRFPKILAKLENLVKIDLSNNDIYDLLPESYSSLPHLEVFNIEAIINAKGKTLTNKSLKECKYYSSYTLCMAEEMSCFDEYDHFEPCTEDIDLSEDDQCRDLYYEFKKNMNKFNFHCINNVNGKTKILSLKVNTYKNRNAIKDPQAVMNAIGELTELQELSLDQFDFIPDLDYDVLKNLKNIQALEFQNLYNNAINEIPDIVFELTSLKSLSIISEELTSISDKIVELKNLEKLVLPYNELTTIPEILSQLENLKELDLSYNYIESEIPESLNNLTHLTRVDFSGNEKIKGKTLTNESLETCEYSTEATDLCIPKKIKCVEEYTFETCEDTNTNNNGDNNGNNNGDNNGNNNGDNNGNNNGDNNGNNNGDNNGNNGDEDDDDDNKISTDYRCGKGKGRCPAGQCCSKYGWCGTSDKHCSVDQGCDSKFGECHATSTPKISKDGRCGSSYGHCPGSKCCSKYGWCGTSDKHCAISKGCQSEFGKCTNDVNPVKGKCGKGYGKCPSGQCCSKYGWCGKDERYCGVGCQSKFGKCK